MLACLSRRFAHAAAKQNLKQLHLPGVRPHPPNVSRVDQPGGRVLCLFDGQCGLCNRTVRWLLRCDRRNRLRFAPIASPQAAELLKRHGYATPDQALEANTIFALRQRSGSSEALLMRSDAVAALLAELPRPWPAVAFVLRSIPRPVRDWGYRLIARERYRIGGRQEICPLPTAKESRRFL